MPATQQARGREQRAVDLSGELRVLAPQWPRLVSPGCLVQPPRQITDGHIVIQGAGGQSSGAGKNMFAFDFMYGPDSTQEQVYSDLGAPLLDKAFGGFNATIFACACYHAAAC